jgi:deoxyguanosine kinase
MKHCYIAIEGVIGVGKSTLARLLQSHFEATILLEVFEENPFLAHFYTDRERYAFQTQIFFLLSRYQQQFEAAPAALARGHLVSDYTFAKDEIFAWLNLKDDELAMYGRVHGALADQLPGPDLIVYLRADHEVIMRRIALRDRPYERDMDPNYIRDLTAAYEAWLNNLQDTAVVTIDTSHLDFLAQNKDLDFIIQRIEQGLQQARDRATGSGPVAAPHPLPGLPPVARLGSYQQFQRELDVGNGFDPDLLFNYTGFVEEVGELGQEMRQIWREKHRLQGDGLDPGEALAQTLAHRRSNLKEELADLLAHLLKLANLAGIDLESAYREKISGNG